MWQRYAFLTHKGCAVYALHFNAFINGFEAVYAAGALCGVT